VRFARHRDIPGRRPLGADLRETIAGVQLADVMTGEFADRVGLQPGDVLLQLGAGAVFSVSDVAFFQREHPNGEEAEIVWSRGAEVCRGRARLGPEDGLVFARRA
jgi:C-terminal processing protease CtpA/Prc